MAYIYILTNANNSTLYVGVTNNLTRRIYEHKEELVKGFSSKYKLHKLVYYEKHQTITQAITREKQLKSWHRGWKIELIQNKNPAWKDLWEELTP